jgi:membrane fusion protein (multidrug efflux system)
MRYVKSLLYLFAVILLLYLLISCSEGKSESVHAKKNAYTAQENFVDTIILTKSVFNKELISNGKLRASLKSDLKFRSGGYLKEVKVRNGSQVGIGQVLAGLDQFEFSQRAEQARIDLKNAKIEFADILMSYKGGDTTNVPSVVYETASLRSGYLNARLAMKTAQFNLDGTILRSPLNGKVANLTAKKYESINPGEVFCTIIDDSEFEVEFSLIESELNEIALNDAVKVVSFTGDHYYRGYVSEINPVIDENGLVHVKAKVKNPGSLWEGMNVKVLVAKSVNNQFVVPKSAVVFRQNQEVLFKYVDGKAVWTYIQKDFENSSSYAVRAHPKKDGTLKPGDAIIISDNMHLGHESQVKIKPR